MLQPGLLPTILPQYGKEQLTKMDQLVPFMKNINCKIIVTKKLEEKPSKDGHLIYSFRVGDETGSAIMTLWDRTGSDVEEGDILLLIGGFVTIFQNEIRLACRHGLVIRQGRFTMQFSETPDHSAFAWVPDPADPAKLIKQAPPEPKAPKPFKKSNHPSASPRGLVRKTPIFHERRRSPSRKQRGGSPTKR